MSRCPQDGGRRVIFLSGDNVDANAVAAGLIERLGFAPIILGEIGGPGLLQQFGEPLMIHA
jgi:8-hydroxy-5-deazaflavin:NADPH oxidoreductase